MPTATKIGCAHCPDEFDTDEQLAKHVTKEHPEKLRRPNKSVANKVLVNVILDKSGSMSNKVADIIGGFNTYIAELKNEKSVDYMFTLTLFDTNFTEKYLASPLSEVDDLDAKSYVPDGNTALNDAIGRTIRLVESDKRGAEKIITVIMTDGEENSSHEFSHDAVKALIEAKQNEGWSFIFLGASLDAWNQGMSLGISPQNVAHYDAQNYRGTFAVSAFATSDVATGTSPVKMAFSSAPTRAMASANRLSVNHGGLPGHGGFPSTHVRTPRTQVRPPVKKAHGWNLQKKK